MVRKIISYFNKDLKFYEALKVVENQSDQDIIGSCRRYLAMCPNNEAVSCIGRSIHIIGLFDDEDVKCPVVSFEEPVFVVDCDEILTSRFPNLYEQRSENN